MIRPPSFCKHRRCWNTVGAFAALLLSTSVEVFAQCDISGDWRLRIEGTESTWRFAPLGSNNYSVEETSHGGAGSAVVSGGQVRLEWQTPDGLSGRSKWTLERGCAAGHGQHISPTSHDSSWERIGSGAPPSVGGPGSLGPEPGTGGAPGVTGPATLPPQVGGGVAPIVREPAALGPEYDGLSISTGAILRFYGSPSAQACRSDCEHDKACQAYTWVRPGGYQPGDPPVCYLMQSYQAGTRHPCCVAATRGPFPGQ